jgi:hypothetical protein
MRWPWTLFKVDLNRRWCISSRSGLDKTIFASFFFCENCSFILTLYQFWRKFMSSSTLQFCACGCPALGAEQDIRNASEQKHCQVQCRLCLSSEFHFTLQKETRKFQHVILKTKYIQVQQIWNSNITSVCCPLGCLERGRSTDWWWSSTLMKDHVVMGFVL